MSDNIQKNVIRHAQADLANVMPIPAERAKEAPTKIGAGHAKAMLKLGAHELTSALAAFPDSNIRPLEEPGVFGNENIPQHIPESHDAQLKAASKRGPEPEQDRGRSR